MSFGLAIYAAQFLGAALALALVAKLPLAAFDRRRFQIAFGLGLALFALFLFHCTSPARLLADFKDAYQPAAAAVAHDPRAIATLLQLGVEGFVNLPILAYLFVPFALLPSKLAGGLFTLAGLLACVFAWRMIGRVYDLDMRGRLALAVVMSAFGPLLYSVREGNLSHFVLLLPLAGAILIRRGSDVSAGALFGLATVVKPPLALFGAYFLLRRRFGVLIGCIAMAAALTAASLLVFGVEAHRIWLDECVLPYMRPLAAFNVQSIDSMLARAQLGPMGLLDWSPHELSPVLRAMALGMKGLLIGGVCWLALGRGVAFDANSRPAPRELALVFLTTCLVSPLTWTHYYVAALPAIGSLLTKPRSSAGRPLALAALGGALAMPILLHVAEIPEAWSALSFLSASHLLIGGMVLWGALALQILRERKSRAAERAAAL